MFEYMSVKEATAKWKISERRIQKLCEQKRIDGVVRFGHSWAIPADANKPANGRRKENKNGVFQFGSKFSKTIRFTDINYAIASKEDKTSMLRR